MNVSLHWLSALLGTPLQVDQVSEALAGLGAPVESVEEPYGALADLVVARVESVARHPDADRLSVCQVDTGSGTVEVVCGAPNVKAGVQYPYAPPGATLPGGLVLKPRKIRGVRSNGMLCSARELELGDEHDGILELDTAAAPGTALVQALGLDDVMLEIDVTPNRPDLLGHRGVARDLGARLGLAVKLESLPGAPAETLAPGRVEREGRVGGVEVRIEDEEGCPRYLAAVVRGVRVGPSPDWLQTRLRSIGQRPINNVVDATNFMLAELNQPMHAFDLDRLRGGRVVIRRGRAGEGLQTLDGVDRALTPDMTLICDGEGPVAVAGVMGGADSEVTSDTTAVLLECAYFAPARIRATRNALRMSTDASYRYERGTDPHAMPDALRRAVALLIAVAGGTEDGPPVDVYPRLIPPVTVFLRPQRVTHLLGVDVPRDEIERWLTRLGFTVAPREDRLAVQVPGWRPDVTREVDLIEEIARLRGYDAFPVEMRPLRPSSVPPDAVEVVAERCRELLTGFGLHEARSLSLGPEGEEGAVEVLHPLSSEERFLRTTLMDGLIRSVERNWAVRVRDVRLFEIGRVFRDAGPGVVPEESLHVAGVISGYRDPRHWTGRPVDFDCWDVKSLLEAVARLVWPGGRVVPDGQRLMLEDAEGTAQGWAGPVAAAAPAWAGAVFGFECTLAVADEAFVRYTPVPETPPAERDLALVLPAGVTAGEVEVVLRREGGGILESVSVFDEYRAGNGQERSVAWRLVFRSRRRTLRDKEVDRTVRKMLNVLGGELGVARREA